MRFDSPEHLQAWQATKRFPAIHDAIANLAIACVRGNRLLDLGCSYGLLGARIVTQAGLEMGMGVDADGAVIAAARTAGVPLTFRELKVTADNLPDLMALFVDSQADVLVARRVLPELYGDNIEAGKSFANMIAGVGVKEIFLEGRVNSPAAVNPLRSIEEEVALLSGPYREVRRVGGVSYMVIRGDG